MRRQIMSLCLVALCLVGCSVEGLLTTMSEQEPPAVNPPPSEPVTTANTPSSTNCYTPIFLSDRGIQIGSQAVVQPQAISTLFASQGQTHLYFERPSLTPDVTLSSGEAVTILNGPYCYSTRNAENRWWQVQVNHTGVIGYVDEYETLYGVLAIHLDPLVTTQSVTQIRHFAVSIPSAFGRPATIAETVYISWDVGNTSDVTLTRMDTGEIIGRGAQSTMPFVVPDTQQGFIDFRLSAVGVGGQNLEEIRTLQIDCGTCGVSGDTIAQPDSITIEMSYQPFEGGMMLYRTDSGEIYILFNSGVARTFANTWQGETFTDDAPAGYVVPQFGFGTIWSNDSGVRDMLGWATAGESYYNATVINSDSDGLILSLPTGQQISIQNGFWRSLSN